MKTFEEKFTAWVDGQLKGRELAEFEAELPHALDARLDQHAAQQIGDLLREHGRAPELTNEDFFNHQLMQRIEAESPNVKAAVPVRRRFAWSLPRLALAGAFSLLVAFGLFRAWIPTKPQAVGNGNGMTITSSNGTVKVYYSPENNVNIVYLNGTVPSESPKHASPRKEKEKEKPNN
jgi:anti-sigma factor RsiW